MTIGENFGSVDQRSATGSLLNGELQKISGFLKSHGLLVVGGLGGLLLLAHPTVMDQYEATIKKEWLQRIIIGASIDALRGVADINVAETRALEALTPGPLILVKAGGDELGETLIAIPDSRDLRDISSTLGGVARGFLQTDPDVGVLLDRISNGFKPDGRPPQRFAVLNQSAAGESASTRPTFVRISGPRLVECIVEGELAAQAVVAASDTVSQWEIEDWT